MLTHLATYLLSGMADLPILALYALVALWAGADCAGLPIPMEPALLFLGALVAEGKVILPIAIGIVALAELIFAGAAYELGRRVPLAKTLHIGRYVGLTPTRAEHVELWLRTRGIHGAVIASITPMLRTFAPYIMGVARLPRGFYLIGTLAGASLYSAVWLILGAALGKNYQIPLRYLDRLGVIGLGIALLVVCAVCAVRFHWGQRALARISHLMQRERLFHSGQRFTPFEALSPQLAAPRGLLNLFMTESTVPRAESSAPTRQLAGAWSTRPLVPHRTKETPLAHSQLSSLARSVGRGRLASAHMINQVHATTRATREEMRRLAAQSWPRWLGAIVGASWLLIALAVALCSVVASRFPLFPFDVPITAWIQQLRGTPVAPVINVGGDLQSPMQAGIALVLLYSGLVLFGFVREAICLAILNIGADATHLTIKALVARPRPHSGSIVGTVFNLGQQSFPSGHAAHTLAIYGFLFYLCLLALHHRSSSRAWLIGFQALCLYFIVMVGPSRILEGQHWPSDVLVGYLIGALWLTIGIAVYHLLASQWVRRRREREIAHRVTSFRVAPLQA
jgi:membrane protein DedA with SNARE-associated domain/membrane-associated phospholipid phosphatase